MEYPFGNQQKNAELISTFSRYDSRVKAMEVDEKPTEDYNDVGGLDKQIEEMVEAIVLPMTQRERFQNLGIKPPKGCLMYGPVSNVAWHDKMSDYRTKFLLDSLELVKRYWLEHVQRRQIPHS